MRGHAFRSLVSLGLGAAGPCIPFVDLGGLAPQDKQVFAASVFTTNSGRSQTLGRALLIRMHVKSLFPALSRLVFGRHAVVDAIFARQVLLMRRVGPLRALLAAGGENACPDGAVIFLRMCARKCVRMPACARMSVWERERAFVSMCGCVVFREMWAGAGWELIGSFAGYCYGPTYSVPPWSSRGRRHRIRSN